MSIRQSASSFAEQNLLSILLSDPSLYVKIADQVGENDFTNKNNRTIFSLIAKLNAKNKEVSPDIIEHEILKLGLNADTLIPHLEELSLIICDADELDSFIAIIRENTSKRLLQELGNTISNTSSDSLSESSDILNLAEQKIYEISKRKNISDFIGISQVVDEYLDATENVRRRGNRITGLNTGYSDLSNIISGFQPEQYIILAARPSVGKSAFALNIAYNIAKSFIGTKKTIAFFSLEMSTQQIIQRLVSLVGYIDAYRLQNASLLTAEDMKRFYFAISELKKFNILFDDASSSSINDLRTKCRKLKEKDNLLELIIVDYLQLLNEDDVKGSNRQETVARISRKIKELARELKIPILALSQVSRDVSKNKTENAAPDLSHLRESGALEQDADIVMMLHRPSKDDTPNETDENGGSKINDSTLIQLEVVKNRQGRRGTCQFLFEGKYSKFTLRTQKEAEK